MIFERLKRASDRYREIEQMLTLPEVVADRARYSSLIKEYNSLMPVITKYGEYTAAEREMQESDTMMRDSSLDAELRELARTAPAADTFGEEEDVTAPTRRIDFEHLQFGKDYEIR